MSSRLMFSLLTYQNHECLALDEGLGTGDKNFYDKAEVRLNDFLEVLVLYLLQAILKNC